MKKFLLWFVLVINLGIIFYFWWSRSGLMLFSTSDKIFISLGRITGLLAVFFILLQLILIGRVKWVEKIFGLDKLSLVHHWAGVFIPLLVLAHLLFITFGYSLVQKINFWTQTWEFIIGWELFSAYVAAFLFILITVTSIYIVFSKKLKYEWWFFIHLSVYLAILWSFEHQLELGEDFGSSLFAVYWWLLYIFAFGNLIVFRFLRPIWYFYKHRFVVDRVVEECPGVWSIYIIGKDLAKFKFLAGQFAIWRFLDKKNWWQAHPFSFSAVPNGRYLRITYKNLGDYTASLKNVKSGTYVLLDGPSGIFTSKRTDNNKLLLIAGGVGITPVRALLEDLVNLKKDAVLLYGSRSKKDIIFHEEIKNVCAVNGRVCNILNNSEDWDGEIGKIDEEKIVRLVSDYLERDVYVCGPPIMMRGVMEALQKIGVKKSRIYFEKFSLGS